MTLRACLLFGLLFAALLTVAADDPPPEVTVERVDAPPINGRLLNKSVAIETPYGTTDVRTSAIQRILFSPGQEPGHDVIEFMDDNHVRGTVSQPLRLQTDAGEVTLKPDEVRELRMLRKPQLGIGAIILGLITLSAMEIVLGIDNIIFLTIVAGKLPQEQQPRARRLGLIFALGTRILLLLSLSFLLGLTKPVFTIPDMPFFHDLETREVSLRDLILMAGGLFLIWKSVREMHEKLEAAREGTQEGAKIKGAVTFTGVLIQIAILDLVFSLDSVITAVGMVDQVWVMITAMVIAMFVMMASAKGIGDFVARHPTLKVLALAFLILIGVLLVAESLGQHINKGYIYFAMAFSVAIEMINMRLRKPKPGREKGAGI